MGEIIAIANQKGGVSKTTSASAIGAGLTRRGYKVLMVDLDSQTNLTYNYGLNNVPLTSLELLTGTATAQEATQHTETRGDIIPAKSGLALIDSMIPDGPDKWYRLKEALEPVKEDYDFIVLDCPPILGTLVNNALTACDSVIIPAEADIYSLMGLGQLNQTLGSIRKYTNPGLVIDGILPTRYKGTVVTKELAKALQETADSLGTTVYATPIRDCNAVKEANALRKDIFNHAPNSNATADYTATINEFLSKRGK